jgi:pimeloyl-ACP methyl ester carboxylesterase
MATWQINEIRKTPGNKACIIFIHGFNGHTTFTWGRFPDLLCHEPAINGWDVVCFGYKSSLAPDIAGIWTGKPRIQTIARSLRTFIDTSFSSSYDALTLIAHSMGGLVVQRALLDEETLTQKVDKVLLFGTPSFGLSKAWLFQLPIMKTLFRQPRDMGKNSTFIKTLRKDWLEKFGKVIPFDFLTVAGSEDQFVPMSASIDGFPEHQWKVVKGNHSTIVALEKTGDASLDVAISFIAKKEKYKNSWKSSDLALERREFHRVISQLKKNRKRLDSLALVTLALAYEGLGRRAEAIEVLGDARRHGTDAMGVLAGRYKRNWLQERIDDDARTAFDLYSEAYELCRSDRSKAAQSFYHGINLAFLSLIYNNDLGRARDIARQVLQHCADAKLNEIKHTPEDIMWRRATEGEAHLILRNFDAAIEHYTSMLQGPPKPDPWQLTSTVQQAKLIADKLGDEPLAQSLLKLFSGDQP